MRRKINVINNTASKHNPAAEQLKEAQNRVRLLQIINKSIGKTTDMSRELIGKKRSIVALKPRAEREKILLIRCDHHIKLISAERNKLTQLLTHLQAQPARSTLIEYAKIRNAIQSIEKAIEQTVIPKAQSARATEITTAQLAKSLPPVPTHRPGNPTGNSGGGVERDEQIKAILRGMKSAPTTVPTEPQQRKPSTRVHTTTYRRPDWTLQPTASSNSHSFFNAYRLNKLLNKLPQLEKDSGKLLKSQTDALDKLENMLPRFGK